MVPVREESRAWSHLTAFLKCHTITCMHELISEYPGDLSCVMSIPTWTNQSSWRYVITMDEESHLHIMVWLDFDVAGPVDIFLINSQMLFDGF